MGWIVNTPGHYKNPCGEAQQEWGLLKGNETSQLWYVRKNLSMIHTESCTSLADRIEFSVHGSRAPSRWRGCSPSPLPGPRRPQSYAIGISCWCWSSFFATMSTTPKKIVGLLSLVVGDYTSKIYWSPILSGEVMAIPKKPKLPTATGPTSKRMISGAGEVELGSRARPCRGKTPGDPMCGVTQILW